MEKEKESKYKGYKPEKGVTPPWDPFNPEKRKKRITIKEKKFLYMLSKTGNMNEAYRSAYKVKAFPSKQLENARVNAMATQVLNRLKKKAPEFTAALTFDDINPDFVRKEMMSTYKDEKTSQHDRIRILELMGKMHAMFTEKQIVTEKVDQIMSDIYTEGEEDFPEKDDRVSRIEMDKIGQA